MRNKHAFTLIELLVVVAIIVALLAILLPSMNRALEVTNRAVCGSQLKQQGVAILAYASDQFGKMMTPIRSNFWPDGGYHDSAGQPASVALLYDGGYLTDDGRLMYCPSHVQGGPPWGLIWTYEGGWQNTDFSGNDKWWNTWTNYTLWPNYRNGGDYAPGLPEWTVDSVNDTTGNILATESITYDVSGNPAGGRSYSHQAEDGSDGPAGGNVQTLDLSVRWLNIDETTARLLHAGREWWF